MSKIVKTFICKHIDLSKVVSISDAYFIDNMGHGGWFVGFHMDVQLMDSPISYRRALNSSECIFEKRHILIYGRDKKIPLAVENLQKQIDQLIIQWKEVIENDN